MALVKCATCTKVVKIGKGSRPAGVAQCKPCRDAAALVDGTRSVFPCASCKRPIKIKRGTSRPGGQAECRDCRFRNFHVVSQIDVVARAGVCSICGPTSAIQSAYGWLCATVKAQSAARDAQKRDAAKLKFRTLVLEQQLGKCAICCRTLTPSAEKLQDSAVVDHCHKTGFIRNLLCGNCNRGLGMFFENPEFLRKAAEYLEFHLNKADGIPYRDYNLGVKSFRDFVWGTSG